MHFTAFPTLGFVDEIHDLLVRPAPWALVITREGCPYCTSLLTKLHLEQRRNRLGTLDVFTVAADVLSGDALAELCMSGVPLMLLQTPNGIQHQLGDVSVRALRDFLAQALLA